MHKISRRIIIISCIGTIIEWAEYAFYGYMAVLMAAIFFPKEDARAALLASLGVFAAGFMMRPIGALLISHIADIRGRKQALLYSMFIMGLATFSIGLLPTYHQVGIAAPILLFILRLTQGLAVASESLSAAVFLIEHARGVKPNLTGSWPGMAAAFGVTLGAMAAFFVTQSTWSFAWRIPFIIGALSCFAGLYLRQKIAESPVFIEAELKKQLVKIPVIALCKGYGSAIFKTAAIAIFVATIVYVCNLYFATYLIEVGKMQSKDALLVTTVGELLVVCFFPLCGYAADCWGGERLIKYGLLLFGVSAPVIFILGSLGSVFYALIAQLIYAFLDALITAPMFKWLYDEFPIHIRVTGMAVSWNVAVALLGGTAPLIVQFLMLKTGMKYSPGVYVSFISFLTFGVLYSHDLFPSLAKGLNSHSKSPRFLS